MRTRHSETNLKYVHISYINLVGFSFYFYFYVEVKTTVLWHNSSSNTIPFQRWPNFEDCHDSYYFTPLIVNSITA